jgi:hypothetical protein
MYFTNDSLLPENQLVELVRELQDDDGSDWRFDSNEAIDVSTRFFHGPAKTISQSRSKKWVAPGSKFRRSDEVPSGCDAPPSPSAKFRPKAKAVRTPGRRAAVRPHEEKTHGTP